MAFLPLSVTLAVRWTLSEPRSRWGDYNYCIVEKVYMCKEYPYADAAADPLNQLSSYTSSDLRPHFHTRILLLIISGLSPDFN
eukprot:6193104-Pleurochrysis_carterae.AAC.1